MSCLPEKDGVDPYPRLLLRLRLETPPVPTCALRSCTPCRYAGAGSGGAV